MSLSSNFLSALSFGRSPIKDLKKCTKALDIQSSTTEENCNAVVVQPTVHITTSFGLCRIKLLVRVLFRERKAQQARQSRDP